MAERRDWNELRALYREVAIAGLARSVAPDAPHYALNVQFAERRFEEGVELAAYFAGKYPNRRLRILDLGAGNGGVSLAMANAAENDLVALDVVVNEDLAALRARSGVPVSQVVATGDRLPFDDASFEAVLCLETIEHLPDVRTSAREMMRVTKPGGQVMITTPARLRFLFKPDPHYSVRGLLLLPDPLQRHVVVERLRRTDDYDVQHIFWTAGGIVRHFPGRGRVDTLVAIPWPGRPRNLKEVLWKVCKRLLWDRIVIWKT
jgi:SAM-dependent methyltransferase